MRARFFSQLRLFFPTLAVSLALALPFGCGGGKPVSSPWGQPAHTTGPIQDPEALRSALEWGRKNARNAKETLEAFYEFTLRQGIHVQRARIQTRWSRLALHAAERMRSSQEPDPRTVERLLKGPPLTITLIMQGYHKGLTNKLDMVLMQGSRRAYAPTLKRGPPRAITDDGRVVAYEGEVNGDFPLDDLNVKRSAQLEIREEDGSFTYIDIPLWRLK
ncbi:MAG: hypothetical protein V3T44_06765 [bacterium]